MEESLIRQSFFRFFFVESDIDICIYAEQIYTTTGRRVENSFSRTPYFSRGNYVQIPFARTKENKIMNQIVSNEYEKQE
jgi:hypothetical protein